VISFAAAEALAFVRAHTALAAPPLLPEIRLHLASELTPLWQATEATLAVQGLAPPYWAFAWVGGQALARYLLDEPEAVRGKRVLDFAAGSGVAGIAALKAGAAAVTASELEPLAHAAIALNAAANGVAVTVCGEVVVSFGDAGNDLGAAVALDQIGRAVVVGNANNLFGVARLLGDLLPEISLTISLTAPNSVVVSWPDTGSYTLQTNGILSTSSWNAYGGTINTSNGTNSVTITPPLGNLFFRLANP